MTEYPAADIHLYLVSAQATPNITPALDAATRPRQVILLVSPDMRERADWLEQVLKSAAGIQVTRWPIQHAWDIEHVQERVLELLAEYEHAAIALNATGGTKPMSIAAYEAFRAFGKPIFYVHPERDQLIWMSPRGLPRHQLADRIRIPQFVQAYGSNVRERGAVRVPPAYREFAAELIADIRHYSGALGVLNWYANSAERGLRSDTVEYRHLKSPAFVDLLKRIRDLGIATAEHERLVFSSEEARFFANGGWLEQYVFSTLNGLKKDIPAIQDTAMSLQIERGNAVPNEIDVACLADNKLHLIECKAKNFRRGDSNSGAETLYKLDSLADLIGGLQARALLVSYKPLRDHDLKRAQELQVKILQESQLQSLRQHLTDWIEGR